MKKHDKRSENFTNYSSQSLRQVTVIAQRNFTCGPAREIVIREGSKRNVTLQPDDSFFTTTDAGHFFGWCHVSQGWSIIS